MSYECPVCGYLDMPQPANNHSICSCCGTQFELDDFEKSYDELRADWIANGCPWFSRAVPEPSQWRPFVQLALAGFIPSK